MVSRILTPDDKLIVPDYVSLFNRVLDEVSQYYSPQGIAEVRSKYSLDYVANNLQSPDTRFVGHFYENGLDGLLIEGFDCKDGNRTTLNWVMAGRKGAGIGTELVMDCIERARAEKKDNVTLAVSVLNTRARDLYSRLGFVSGGKYNKHGTEFELMGYLL